MELLRSTTNAKTFTCFCAHAIVTKNGHCQNTNQHTEDDQSNIVPGGKGNQAAHVS